MKKKVFNKHSNRVIQTGECPKRRKTSFLLPYHKKRKNEDSTKGEREREREGEKER